jgi:hypothetical protein
MPRKTGIQAVSVTHPTSGKPAILVDTPGLDDTNNTTVLTDIFAWLKKT